jgi:hypothetical protein
MIGLSGGLAHFFAARHLLWFLLDMPPTRHADPAGMI